MDKNLLFRKNLLLEMIPLFFLYLIHSLWFDGRILYYMNAILNKRTMCFAFRIIWYILSGIKSRTLLKEAIGHSRTQSIQIVRSLNAHRELR